MSQEYMDPELFADFIIEAKEHLETIEPNLLELEKAPNNLALLNDIFRPMHSLKGASGFLGLNRMNLLAHKAENILDELRKGSMIITSEIMDVILAATDALRQMIDNLDKFSTEGDVAIETIANQIDAIMAGESEGVDSAEAEAYDESYPDAADAGDRGDSSSNLDGSAATLSTAQDPDKAENAEDIPISQREWLATLDSLASYSLTAFGEAHLRDFIEEAREITANLTSGLLEMERNPDANQELVNDLFRYFHNLKGNSGIIGFQELNSLTHEAETLLNRVRHNEMQSSHELIDLLLLVVDLTDCMVDGIDAASGNVTPLNAAEVLEKLQEAVAGGPIGLPDALVMLTAVAIPAPDEEETPVEAVETAAKETLTVYPIGAEPEEDDLSAFEVTVNQQMSIIKVSLAEIERDSSQKDHIDATYRSLIAVQNASNFMQLRDLRVYAERTAGIVNQGRKSGIDFSLMVDLLRQEVDIINDMVKAEVQKRRAAALEPAPESTAALAETPAPGSVGKETPASETKETTSPKKNKAKDAVQAESAKPEVTTAAKPTDPKSAATSAELKSDAKLVDPKSDAKPIDPKSDPKPTEKPEDKSTAKTIENAVKPEAKPAAPKQVEPLKPKPAEVAKPAVAAETEHKASSTIRVDHEKLDHLMNSIGELIINRNRYTMIARRLEESVGVTREVSEIAQDLTETTYAMARISDDLQDTIMKVRMVPVASVFSRFPRLVRDLSRKSGKEVDLILEGEETELDKSVVEVIGDPLVHLIRNAVDHGVEAEAERVAKGKPVKGRVVLRAFHKGNSVAIEIEDDGNGLDPEKLRDVAVRKGLMTLEEAKLLDDREAKELIFAPGFSSAEKITDISGRGVGMDVVRTNIKALKGSININSELGRGTRFTLSLPLTLAIIDALMIQVAGETFAIPLDAVSETTKIEAARLTDVKGRKAVTLRGEVLGIVELSEILGLERKPLPEVLSMVVIHDNERRLGLVVDRLLERQEIVIKPLGSYLGDVRGISGATIMGDGGVILILDPHEIYIIATSNKGMLSQ